MNTKHTSKPCSDGKHKWSDRTDYSEPNWRPHPDIPNCTIGDIWLQCERCGFRSTLHDVGKSDEERARRLSVWLIQLASWALFGAVLVALIYTAFGDVLKSHRPTSPTESERATP